MKLFKQGFTRRAVCLAALMVATVGLALVCVSCENGLGANEKTGKYNLAEICSEIPDHVSSIYTANHDVRKVALSDPDNIKGEGSWNIQLSYKPFLVTGGEAPGLYYAVKACVNIDNSKMYNKRWWNQHGGVYVRLTGYYLNNFVATFMPTAKLADTEYPVEFPVNCEPTPKTQSESTRYDCGYKYGFSGGVHAGGSKEKGPEAGVDFSGSFEYSESKSYEIHDINILNNRGTESRKKSSNDEKKSETEDVVNVNYVSYKLQLNNLPEYKYSEYRGFTEGCNACKSTVEFNTCWLWHIPGDFSKDNMPTLSVKISGKPEYGAMSWISSGADLDTKTFNDGEKTQTIVFKKP